MKRHQFYVGIPAGCFGVFVNCQTWAINSGEIDRASIAQTAALAQNSPVLIVSGWAISSEIQNTPRKRKEPMATQHRYITTAYQRQRPRKMPITASVVAITPPNAIVRKITEAIPATALHAQDSITIPAAPSRRIIGYPYRGDGFLPAT